MEMASLIANIGNGAIFLLVAAVIFIIMKKEDMGVFVAMYFLAFLFLGLFLAPVIGITFNVVGYLWTNEITFVIWGVVDIVCVAAYFIYSKYDKLVDLFNKPITDKLGRTFEDKTSLSKKEFINFVYKPNKSSVLVVLKKSATVEELSNFISFLEAEKYPYNVDIQFENKKILRYKKSLKAEAV